MANPWPDNGQAMALAGHWAPPTALKHSGKQLPLNKSIDYDLWRLNEHEMDAGRLYDHFCG